MWHLGTWFSGGLGSVRFTVGLDDLKGLFQPKLFYDYLRYFPFCLRERKLLQIHICSKSAIIPNCLLWATVGLPVPYPFQPMCL